MTGKKGLLGVDFIADFFIYIVTALIIFVFLLLITPSLDSIEVNVQEAEGDLRSQYLATAFINNYYDEDKLDSTSRFEMLSAYYYLDNADEVEIAPGYEYDDRNNLRQLLFDWNNQFRVSGIRYDQDENSYIVSDRSDMVNFQTNIFVEDSPSYADDADLRRTGVNLVVPYMSEEGPKVNNIWVEANDP